MDTAEVHPFRINVGCGSTPTQGWSNYDNSLTVRLARVPGLFSALRVLNLLASAQMTFLRTVREADIRWANVSRRIPMKDNSTEVVYSSHMFEHLDRTGGTGFLLEVYRVLAPGGRVRVVVPDLALLIRSYGADGDADGFVEKTLLTRARPTGLFGKLRWLFVGDRGHLWMYDGPSLAKFLVAAGFVDVKVMPAGETRIPSPGQLNLREREDESVYVEARKP